MQSEFSKDCRSLIIEISKDAKINLNPVDLLLWIYLNIYFYQRDSIVEIEYNRDVFLNQLCNSKHFYVSSELYEGLGEGVYLLLKVKILEVYSYKQQDGRSNKDTSVVVLKEMEVLYEGLLLEGDRSRTGAYYTPQPIVGYMVVNSLMTYLKNQLKNPPEALEDFILHQKGQLELEDGVEVAKVLEKIKIIDLACGGGVFLREAFRIIFKLRCNLNQYIDANVAMEQILREILDNIYGIDIQWNTVILCKLLLLMEYEGLGGLEEENIELKILCENALTMEDNTEAEELSSFDIVLGNPPYIGERGNRQIFNDIKETTFGKRYYEGKMDYFYFFIHRGGEILKKGGVLGLITTNYFVTADGASKLRSFLRENFSFKEIVNFNEANVFKDAAGQHNMIFIAVKKAENPQGPRLITLEDKKLCGGVVMEKVLRKEVVEGVHIATLKGQEELYDQKGQILLQSSYEGAEVLNKIAQVFNYTLGDFCQVNQGIVSGADRLTAPWAEKLGFGEDKGKGIFVLTEEEVKEKGFNEIPYCHYLKDFYKNSHVKRYHLLNNQGLKILYLDDEDPDDIEKLPKIHQHLSKYTPLLKERREVRQGSRKWYALQWPRKREIFDGEKLVVPQRALENTFAYHRGEWYASADVYYITLKEASLPLKTILAILNSSLVYFWLLHRGKRKGEYLELYGTPLKAIPFPTIIELTGLTELENLVAEIEDHLVENKDVQHLQGEINEIVYDLYQLKEEEKDIIRRIVKERRGGKG